MELRVYTSFLYSYKKRLLESAAVVFKLFLIYRKQLWNILKASEINLLLRMLLHVHIQITAYSAWNDLHIKGFYDPERMGDVLSCLKLGCFVSGWTPVVALSGVFLLLWAFFFLLVDWLSYIGYQDLIKECWLWLIMIYCENT